MFVAGTQSARPTFECNHQGCDDGGVQIASAVLPGSTDDQIRYVPYRHANSFFIPPLLERALVDVDNENHATYRIVKSFLQDGAAIPQCCGAESVHYNPPHLRGDEAEQEGLVWLRLKNAATGERLTFTTARVAPPLGSVAREGESGSLTYWGVTEGSYDVLVCGPRGFISSQFIHLDVEAARPFVPPAIGMTQAGLTCR